MDCYARSADTPSRHLRALRDRVHVLDRALDEFDPSRSDLSTGPAAHNAEPASLIGTNGVDDFDSEFEEAGNHVDDLDEVFGRWLDRV